MLQILASKNEENSWKILKKRQAQTRSKKNTFRSQFFAIFGRKLGPRGRPTSTKIACKNACKKRVPSKRACLKYLIRLRGVGGTMSAHRSRASRPSADLLQDFCLRIYACRILHAEYMQDLVLDLVQDVCMQNICMRNLCMLNLCKIFAEFWLAV